MSHQPLLEQADVEVVVSERGVDTSPERVHRMQSSELGHVVPIKAGLKQVGIYLLLISMLAAGVLFVVKSQWQELRSYKGWLLFWVRATSFIYFSLRWRRPPADSPTCTVFARRNFSS